MKKTYATCFIVILNLIILTGGYGCGGDSSTGLTPAALVSISVTPATPIISTTLQFTAIGTYSDDTTKDITSSVTWNSSNTETATIMNSGLAVSIHAGLTTITATSGNISGTTTLTVTSATLSSISVTPANPSVPVGGAQQFAASGIYSDGTTHDITTQVVWLSSKASIATVNSVGLAEGTATGTSTITAKYGTISGSASLTVKSTTGAFSIETIAQGDYPAIAVDSHGNPHISYLDNNDHFVKYAFKEGSGFTISSVGYVANSHGTIANGGLSSIALDAANNAHITYYDYGNGDYKYAQGKGNSWTTSSIPLPNDPLMSYASPFLPWAESSIVVDKTTNTAHVAMQLLGGLSGYVLGYWKTGLPNALIVDSMGDTGFQNAITLDGNGFPLISYEARQSGTLKYACWNGSMFTVESVGGMLNVYWENRLSSLAVDQGGNPHIAYYGQDGYKYARKNGVLWSVESLPEHDGYPSISLSLDGTGKPHIALIAYGKLRYGYWNGSSWAFSTIDEDAYDCVITVDELGEIHIVYSQGSLHRVVKYASK